jgi:hypothetical protein
MVIDQFAVPVSISSTTTPEVVFSKAKRMAGHNGVMNVFLLKTSWLCVVDVEKNLIGVNGLGSWSPRGGAGCNQRSQKAVKD